jgi:hypothetical protein
MSPEDISPLIAVAVTSSCVCSLRIEDTMEIISESDTIPSIVRLMSNPMQSKQVMSSCFSTLVEVAKSSEAIEAIAKTDALSLALHYVDDNVFELPKEVRRAAVPVTRG